MLKIWEKTHQIINSWYSDSMPGFLRTKTKLVIWSVKSWPLNFWSVICKYLISSWSSWSLILLIFDLWWTLMRWSVKQLDLWSFDLPWSLWLIFWSHWSLNCDVSFQLEMSFVEQNHRNTKRLQQVLFVDTFGKQQPFRLLSKAVQF